MHPPGKLGERDGDAQQRTIHQLNQEILTLRATIAALHAERSAERQRERSPAR